MDISPSNLVEIIIAEHYDTLSRSVAHCIGSRNTVEFQHIERKNQQQTSSNHRNIVLYKEVGVSESNTGVRIFTGTSVTF